MGAGDEIMAAGHAQSMYDANPSRRIAICDRRGYPRWDPIWEGNPIIARPAEVYAGEPVERIWNANGCRPYITYPFTHDGGLTVTRWRARDHVGRIYLTESEREAAHRIRGIHGPFVLIEPSLKKSANQNKRWPFERYEAVISACPDRTFLQMIHPDSQRLAGAVDIYVQDFRLACALVSAADAYVGPEGGLHHAAAVLGIPAVVVFGGYISPETTGYPGHVNLADTGQGSPCGRWRPCEHCREAMDRITVGRVVEALTGVLDSTRPAAVAS